MDRYDIDYKKCDEFLDSLDYNNLNSYHTSRRYHRRVFVTKNMHLLLHCLLTSLDLNMAKPKFEPNDKVRDILKNYTNLDIINTYSRLGINRGYFSDFIVEKSKDYTLKKKYLSKKAYAKKRHHIKYKDEGDDDGKA